MKLHIDHSTHHHEATPGARQKCRDQLAELKLQCNEAYALVVADVRESYPEMSWDEAASHAYDTVTLVSPAPVGATTLDHDGSRLAWAYQIFLEDQNAIRGFARWMASQTPPPSSVDALDELDAILRKANA